jgi:hypothetical protein
MSKIKAGQVHTAGHEVIAVELENQTSRGNFEILLCGAKLGIEQARHLLTSAADKAEVLDAAVGG